MTRVCSNGHAVPQDDLKACPRCGASLAPPAAKAPSLVPETDEPVSVPLALPFVVGGVVLASFGVLLTYAAQRGPAEDFGWVLLAAAVVLVVLGLRDGIRRRR